MAVDRLVMIDQDREIFYLGEDKVLKDDLENGLNRDLYQVSTITDFTHQLGDNNMRNSTIILTDNVHAEIRSYLDDVVDLLEMAIDGKSNTVVIEIGLQSKVVKPHEVSPYVFRYPNAVELIKDRRKEVRGVTVEKAMDDDGALEYQEAYIDFQRQIDEMERERDKNQKEIKELNENVKLLQREYIAIENKYNQIKIEWDNMENNSDSIKEQLITKTEDLDRVIIELDDIKERYDKELEKSRDYYYENLALVKQRKNRETEVEGLKHQIKDLKVKLEEMKDEREDMIHRMSSFDDYGDMGEELTRLNKENSNLEEELMNTRVNLKQKEIEYDELQDMLDELSKDEVEIQEFGRSLGDAHCKLRNVIVYYFKVIHELPYFNSHIEKFIKLLNEDTDRHRIVKTCIIRYDEGFDTEYFNGVGIYSNLGNASEDGGNRFRLYPSRKMFLGSENFEDTVDTLVVLDYTRNNNYMIDTDNDSRKFNVITTSKLKNKLNLRGTDISTDKDASLPLRHNSEIANSRVQLNKELLIEETVRRWMHKIEIL